MPTVRLLKTTLGGYELFNLTSTVLASFFIKTDISSQITGSAVNFYTSLPVATPYISGSLDIFLDGVLQNHVPGYIVAENPATGFFQVSTPPSVGQILVIRYIQA